MQGSNNKEKVPFKWVTAQPPLKNKSENIKGETPMQGYMKYRATDRVAW